MRALNDPGLFSFVISTRNRPAFLRRALQFLQQQSFAGSLLIVDASDTAPFAATADFLRTVPGMSITHFRPTPTSNNWTETAQGVRTIGARYVLWLHDDDFYFLDAVKSTVDSLLANPETVSAQGREVFVTARLDGGRFGVQLSLSPRFSYGEATPTERLRRAFAAYCHLFFSVIRREVFIEASEHVAGRLTQGWFDQYAWSVIVASRGPCLLSDQLFGARQKHAANHSRLLKAYDNWPLLAANPEFSRIFSDFKECIVAAVPADPHALRGIIDDGLTSLIARQYDAATPPDEVDRAIIDACGRPGTVEHRKLAAAAQMIASFPETI